MGVGLAELLASGGGKVTVVTPLPIVAPFLDRTFEGTPVRQQLARLGVRWFVDTELAEITSAHCRLRQWGRDFEIEADEVVLVTARRSRDHLYRELSSDPAALGVEGVEAVYRAGDCVAPRLLADAIFDGHRLGRELDSPDPARALPYLRERDVLRHAAPAPATTRS